MSVDGGRDPSQGEADRLEHDKPLGSRLNQLRAAVLGANDGIVSEAGIVVGVAGATVSRGPVFTAGLAGLVAGAVSMSLGEYVSVSSQRDVQRSRIEAEQQEWAAIRRARSGSLPRYTNGRGSPNRRPAWSRAS
jgi:VIT1/CCC1 family predicted Fe2+/Mn2+ transporter